MRRGDFPGTRPVKAAPAAGKGLWPEAHHSVAHQTWSPAPVGRTRVQGQRVKEDDVARAPNELNHAGEIDASRSTCPVGPASSAPKVRLPPHGPIALYDQRAAFRCAHRALGPFAVQFIVGHTFRPGLQVVEHGVVAPRDGAGPAPSSLPLAQNQQEDHALARMAGCGTKAVHGKARAHVEVPALPPETPPRHGLPYIP